MAKLRYGPDTDKGFVCKEFLLPEQHADFLSGKGTPALRQKCLVCTRYFTTYLYTLARTDPNFKLAPALAIQTFCNASTSAVELPDHKAVLEAAQDLPSHSSPVSCADGYKPHAMLFVDENFSQHRLQRETRLGALSFRPVVRFNSAHYRYVQSERGDNCGVGGYRLVQVGIGEDDQLNGLGFRRPPPPAATVEAAAPALKVRSR